MGTVSYPDELPYVSDIDQKTFQSRNRFAATYDHFGLVLENQKLFIFGGDRPFTDKYHDMKYVYSDEVRSTAVADIINNHATAQWDVHTKLPTACCVHAFGIVTLPVCSELA